MSLKPSILLIEDNPDHAEFIRRALNDAATDVIIQPDGQAALEYLRNKGNRPSFVLLDVKLPKKDGFEILAILRTNERLRDLPIIMLSTSFNPDEIRRAYRLGVNSFVSKPIDFLEFNKKVKQIKEFWLNVAELPVPDEAKSAP